MKKSIVFLAAMIFASTSSSQSLTTQCASVLSGKHNYYLKQGLPCIKAMQNAVHDSLGDGACPEYPQNEGGNPWAALFFAPYRDIANSKCGCNATITGKLNWYDTNHPEITQCKRILDAIHDSIGPANVCVGSVHDPDDTNYRGYQLYPTQFAAQCKVESVELDDVKYVLSNPIIDNMGTTPDSGGSLRENFCNCGDQEQTSSGVSVTYSKTTSQQFNNTEAIGFGAKASGQAGVPFVAEGKVEVSAEAKFSFSQGNTNSTTSSVSLSCAGTKVPAMSQRACRVTATQWKISLPYTATETVTFMGVTDNQPLKVQTTINGTYTGVNTENATFGWLKAFPITETTPCCVNK